MDAEVAAEPFTPVTDEIQPRGGDGRSWLTLVHELHASPRLAAIVWGEFEDMGAGGGYPWMLSDLKTLLEDRKADGPVSARQPTARRTRRPPG